MDCYITIIAITIHQRILFPSSFISTDSAAPEHLLRLRLGHSAYGKALSSNKLQPKLSNLHPNEVGTESRFILILKVSNHIEKLDTLFDNTKINQSQVGLIFRSRYVSKSFARQRLSFELQQSQQLLCTGDKTIWLVLFFNGQIIIVLCQ